MLSLPPDSLPPNSKPLPRVHPAEGERRARVALLAGCVQQVLAPDINWATLRVLARNGVEVVIPEGQGCCGALMMHTGDAATAYPSRCFTPSRSSCSSFSVASMRLRANSLTSIPFTIWYRPALQVTGGPYSTPSAMP